MISKIVVPGRLGKYEFEFQDHKMMIKKPMLNINIEKDPKIMVKIKSSNIF